MFATRTSLSFRRPSPRPTSSTPPVEVIARIMGLSMNAPKSAPASVRPPCTRRIDPAESSTPHPKTEANESEATKSRALLGASSRKSPEIPSCKEPRNVSGPTQKSRLVVTNARLTGLPPFEKRRSKASPKRFSRPSILRSSPTTSPKITLTRGTSGLSKRKKLWIPTSTVTSPRACVAVWRIPSGSLAPTSVPMPAPTSTARVFIRVPSPNTRVSVGQHGALCSAGERGRTPDVQSQTRSVAIHRGAWKGYSRKLNFAFTEFSEVGPRTWRLLSGGRHGRGAAQGEPFLRGQDDRRVRTLHPP